MKHPALTVELLPETFAVAQLAHDAQLPGWAKTGVLLSLTRTDTELSIVCQERFVPQAIKAQRGYRALRVIGPLEFSQVGVLESLAEPLARSAISIFALSTYDTDYLLVPGKDLDAALSALSHAGHEIRKLGAA
jgi:hypothetical protein